MRRATPAAPRSPLFAETCSFSTAEIDFCRPGTQDVWDPRAAGRVLMRPFSGLQTTDSLCPHMGWGALTVEFSRSVVSDSVTLWAAVLQASLSSTNSQSLIKLIELDQTHVYPVGDAIQPSQHTGHLSTWGVHLTVSCLFTFSYCSWDSHGKNTEVVCHSLLQWTTFCQSSPP